MTAGQTPRTRPPGQTSGSPQRPAQRVSAAVIQFSLTEELARLQSEPAWRQGDRNATTLVKEPNLRVVLTVLKSGARLEQHAAAGRLTIQALRGRLRVHFGSKTADLAAGEVVALEQRMPHDLEALEESAFLLTLAWTADGPSTDA